MSLPFFIFLLIYLVYLSLKSQHQRNNCPVSFNLNFDIYEKFEKHWCSFVHTLPFGHVESADFPCTIFRFY